MFQKVFANDRVHVESSIAVTFGSRENEILREVFRRILYLTLRTDKRVSKVFETREKSDFERRVRKGPTEQKRTGFQNLQNIVDAEPRF